VRDRPGTAWGPAPVNVARMLYTAKCFWPGVTEEELRLAAGRARSQGGKRSQATFRGALYLPCDELVLCLFDAPSSACVKGASERAGMPCERVIETVWVASHEGGGDSTCGI
jgi:hypothetical protein